MQLQTLVVARILVYCCTLLLIESYGQIVELQSSDHKVQVPAPLPQPQIVNIQEEEYENVTQSGRQLLQNILNFLFPDIFSTTLPPDEEDTTTTTTTAAADETTTTTTATATATVVTNNTVVNYYVPVPAPAAYGYPYYGYPYYGYGVGYGYTNYGYYG